jgi:NADPH-dependent 2,4-dienoyl-CoA reductase/sulfur reductase-like enzyme
MLLRKNELPVTKPTHDHLFYAVHVPHVLVIGASLAGLRAVETLRSHDFDGEITVCDTEYTVLYDRPPLSKKFLEGEWEADRIRLRKVEDIDALNATWLTGHRATHLDVQSRTVDFDNGTTQTYDACIIATGGTVRRLPNQPDLAGIHTLRTLDDASALRDDLQPSKHLVVVGAGFIGLEAAATATKRGCAVTVLEGLPAPLIRGLGEEMGNAVGRVHQANGVNIRCNVKVDQILGTDRVAGVRITNEDGASEDVPADVVLIGIGVSPSTHWLTDSGLALDDGIVCDANLQAVPNVIAAGDVARWINPLYSDTEPTMRVEHWTTAAEQGAHAALNVIAQLNNQPLTPYSAVPFFWSDQFTARIQFLGRSTGAEEIRVIAGDPTTDKFAAAYMRNNRLVGVLGVSMPKVVMPSRKLLETHTSWADALAHFAETTTP